MKYIWNSDIAQKLNISLANAKNTKTYFSLTHNRPRTIKKMFWTHKKPNSHDIIIENEYNSIKGKYLRINMKYWTDPNPDFAINGMLIDFEYSLSQDIRDWNNIYKRAVIFADRKEVYSLNLPEDYKLYNKRLRNIHGIILSMVSYFKWARKIEIFLFDEDDLKSA